MSDVRFELRMSLNILEHLGINLYSNVPSVLSEIVANAWDADAEVVQVDWDRETDTIIIQDDGEGMTPEEINSRFLTVGYRRRDEQPGVTAEHGRRPMGRKGIGKLSLFSIAGSVQVETIKEVRRSAFRMRLDDIRKKIEQSGGEGTYHPERLDAASIDFDKGTRITLTELRRRGTIRTTRALKKRVARRFSIIGKAYSFLVYINGEEVTPADREYYDKMQYLWTYRDSSEIMSLAINAKHFDRGASLPEDDPKVSGWLGTVKEVRHLKDEDGDNLNRIAVFVRGKMAQEDILDDFSERGIYASYLIGELHFDDLDIYDGVGTPKDEDAATSSRQTIVEDDARYQTLKRFIDRELKFIQTRWQDLRTEEGSEKALQIPAVKHWIDSLNKPTRDRAKKWLGRINRIRVDELDEHKQLIKHAVLAFEFFNAKENLAALQDIDDTALPAVLDIFKELDSLEASLYGQIIQQRIEVINTLMTRVDENARERAIQEYLFDHLWLLDPHWERAEATEVMEARVGTMFREVDTSLTDEERRGRIDIRYRQTAGQHVIVELKRPERRVRTSELIEQVRKYRSGMKKILTATSSPYQKIDIIVLLGEEPVDWDDGDGPEASMGALRQYDARIVFYDQLLENAERAYQDYLEKKRQVGRLQELIQAIEDYAPPATP